MELLDKKLLENLLDKAKTSPRLRINFDLRTTSEDGSQRMLNALLPGTEVAIHRHPQSTENVLCLCGRMDIILDDDNGIETERITLCPAEGIFGCVIPKGVWHTVLVHEPSVIYESKDRKYGEDGSEYYEPSLPK